jgi:predicted RNA binding protein YcfA (HicA-like mRNA interferase family)
MGRLSGFRYRDVVKRLRYTTIPNHPGDLPEGTLRAILRQAGVSVDDFLSH